MLELPESYTIAEQIRQGLNGKRIAHIEVLHTPHRFAFLKGEKEKYADYLEGQRIEGVVHQGGIIEIATQDCMIALADGAYPKYREEQKYFPDRHHLAIYFDDGSAVFVTIQMNGYIAVFPKGECTDPFYLSSRNKVSPLEEGFTLEYFKGLYPMDGRKVSAKAFLTSGWRIPGLGNGALQDILWEAGIDSRFDMSFAEEEDYQALYTSVRMKLKEMCDNGGRDTEKDLYGNRGGYRTKMSKNSLFKPCPRCGSRILKTSYMGGTIYFCGQCQKVKR